MGSSSSSEQTPPPPPSPTLQPAWRQVTWENKTDLQYVKDFTPQKEEVRHVRVLLYGPVGAGKSSFIGSVRNILGGKMSGLSLANATQNDEKSFTKKYETHLIKKDGGGFYPFVFTDLMGLQDGNGVRVEDIKSAMMGHVKEGYRFNPESSLTTADGQYYNPSPSPEDRVHVLVCVYSANVPRMNDNLLQKMKTIREAASNLGIPQLAIITQIDEACPEIEKDLKNVYKSKHLKKKMDEFSAKLGIPLNCILPVKNYSKEIQLDTSVNALVLSALRLMIDFGDEFIDYKL